MNRPSAEPDSTLNHEEAADALNDVIEHLVSSADGPVGRDTICESVLDIAEMTAAGVDASLVDHTITGLVTREVLVEVPAGLSRKHPRATTSIINRLTKARIHGATAGVRSTSSTQPPSPAPADGDARMTTASPSPDRRTTSEPAARENLVSLLGKRKSKEDCRLEANIEATIFAGMLNNTLQNTISAAVVYGTCNELTVRGQLIAREVKSTLEMTAETIADLSEQAFQDHQQTLNTTERSICALARDMIEYGLDLDDISPPSANSFDPNAASAHHVCPCCCVRTSIIDRAAETGTFSGTNESRWGRHLRSCPNFRGGHMLQALPPPRHVAPGSQRPLLAASTSGGATSTGAAAAAESAPLPPRSDEGAHPSSTDLALQLHSSVGQREADATSQSLRSKHEDRERTLHDAIIETLGEMPFLYDHTSTNLEVQRAIDEVLKAQQAHKLYVSVKQPSLHSTAAVLAMKDLVFADAACNTDSASTSNSGKESSSSVTSRLSLPSSNSAGGSAAPPRPLPPSESRRPNAPEDPSPAKRPRRPTPKTPPAPPRAQPHKCSDCGASLPNRGARHECLKASAPCAAGTTPCTPLPPGTTLGRTDTVHTALLHTLYVQAAGANRQELRRHLSKLTLQGSNDNFVNGRIDSLIRNGWANLNEAGTYTMHPLARAYFATENSRSSRDDLESTLRTDAVRALRNVEEHHDAHHLRTPSPGMPPPPGPPPPATPAVTAPRGRWVLCKYCKKDVWLDEPAMTWGHHKPICRLERLAGSILQAVEDSHANVRLGAPRQPSRTPEGPRHHNPERLGTARCHRVQLGPSRPRHVASGAGLHRGPLPGHLLCTLQRDTQRRGTAPPLQRLAQKHRQPHAAVLPLSAARQLGPHGEQLGAVEGAQPRLPDTRATRSKKPAANPAIPPTRSSTPRRTGPSARRLCLTAERATGRRTGGPSPTARRHSGEPTHPTPSRAGAGGILHLRPREAAADHLRHHGGGPARGNPGGDRSGPSEPSRRAENHSGHSGRPDGERHSSETPPSRQLTRLRNGNPLPDLWRVRPRRRPRGQPRRSGSRETGRTSRRTPRRQRRRHRQGAPRSPEESRRRSRSAAKSWLQLRLPP
ncbi:hypothetical protein T484DRAFT_2537540 [Baffinella frigidus]|nr:hypothetical protein T484DRAFT_2537540 [Cryptophyta sp. CCMP2293]